MSQENSQNPPNSSQQNPSSSSSEEEGDEASSNPNVALDVEPISSYRPGIDQFPDPSLISAGIDPQTQELIKSFGPTDFSSILGPQYQNQDLELEMHLSAVEQFENQNQNQESSSFLRRQKEEYERYQNLNRNRSGIQESSSNVRGPIEFSEDPDSEIAAGTPEILQQDSRPPTKRQRGQSAMPEPASVIKIRETPAPETGASGGVIEGPLVSGLEETGTAAADFDDDDEQEDEEEKSTEQEDDEVVEEDHRFLLCSSTSDEEDDYNTLKFLMSFRSDGGLLAPWSPISLSEYIKERLPECRKITEERCEEKVFKLHRKFLKLRAKFKGVPRLKWREYEMFELGRYIWNRPGSSTEAVDPIIHGADPGSSNVQQGSGGAVEDPEGTVGQGNGADPAANVEPGDGHPGVNVDPENRAGPNPTSDVQQGGDNTGLEDPGQNVGHGAGPDPTGYVEPGADPRENMDLD